MKLIILAGLFVAISSCTSNYQAKNDKSSARMIASSSEMGVSESEAVGMQAEMNAFSSKGSKNFFEMAKTYSIKLKDFQNIAEANSMSPSQKQKHMLNYTEYAKRQITHQTDGHGFIYNYLMSKVSESQNYIKQGQFSKATNLATKVASWIVGG